ncbi:MAG: hypothetical protein AABY07_07945 [Nanoarchaeota archaeon]
MLNHLVIGAGNMGRRHGGILESMGDNVNYYDVKVELSDFRVLKAATDYKYDSVLICTPPETHLNWIIWALNTLKLPIFCEKPIITCPVPKSLILPYPWAFISTLAACNWRFCDCLPSLAQIRYIYCTYPIKNKEFKYLDYIHFLDLFWQELGIPEDIKLEQDSMFLQYRGGIVRNRFTIHDNTKASFTTVNGDLIHNPVCNMFEKQMEHWRNVICGKENSINPFIVAMNRIEYLVFNYEKGDIQTII